MNTVSAQEVFNDVSAMMGWDAEDLDTRQWRDLRDACSAALAEVWEERNAWWPELMRVRELALADDWSAERIAIRGPYAVGDIVFWPDSGAYYMAIAAVSGEPPASWNSTTEKWDETPTRWKELAAEYGDDDVTEYEPGTAYPEDDFTPNSIFRFRDRYYLPRPELLVLGIQDHSPGRYPDYWIELPTFNSVLPKTGFSREPIGAVRRIGRYDPRAYGNALEYEWQELGSDFQVFDFEGPRVWVEFRLVAPKITGDLFDAATVYVAADAPQQIYGEVLSARSEEPVASQVATPVIAPGTGTFISSQLVTITCATAGAAIRYTVDGSTPTETTGTAYAAPFSVASTVTVKARAFATGYLDSDVAAVTLTLGYLVYYGTSTATTLDWAGISALAGSRADSDPAGSYTHTVPTGPDQYLFWCWPDALAAQPRSGDGFAIGGLPLTGDLAGASEGYALTENGWPYVLVAGAGTDYRVYRSKVLQGSLAGPIESTVSI